MGTLSKLVKSYKNRTMEAIKSRRQSENKLHSALSLRRKSSFGLSSLERKKDISLTKKEEISQLLTQYTAQRDSVQRLKGAAEDRLKHEEEEKERIAQEMEFSSSPDDKARISERIKTIDQKITELRSEIKQRNSAEERLAKQIEDVTKSKSKLDLQIRKQAQTKPVLLEQFKSSTRAEEMLRTQVKSKLKQEEQAKRNLVKITERLAILQAKKRKAKQKVKKKTKRKSKAKRKTKSMKKSKKMKRSKTRTRKALKRKSKVKHKAKTRKKRNAKSKKSKSRRR